MRRMMSILFLLILLTATGCKTAEPRFKWVEPVTDISALPLETGLFIDAAFLRRAQDSQIYLSIDESIELAALVNDEAERQLTGAKMNLIVQNKYFISSYRDREQLIAQQQDSIMAMKPTPIHMDPTVCLNEKSAAQTAELWMLTREVFTDNRMTIPAELTRSLALRFRIDTFINVIAISRKDDDIAPNVPPPMMPEALTNQAASLIAVAVIRADDGQVVYKAVTPIPGPQRESTIRGAVKTVFSGVPIRKHHATYPVPSPEWMTKREETPQISTDPLWLTDPSRTGPHGNRPINPVKVDPNSGRPGILTGQPTISLLRRPMGLADPISMVPENTPCLVLKRDVNWYLVKLDDGTMGWVYHTWVKFH